MGQGSSLGGKRLELSPALHLGHVAASGSPHPIHLLLDGHHQRCTRNTRAIKCCKPVVASSPRSHSRGAGHRGEGGAPLRALTPQVQSAGGPTLPCLPTRRLGNAAHQLLLHVALNICPNGDRQPSRRCAQQSVHNHARMWKAFVSGMLSLPGASTPVIQSSHSLPMARLRRMRSGVARWVPSLTHSSSSSSSDGSAMVVSSILPIADRMSSRPSFQSGAATSADACAQQLALIHASTVCPWKTKLHTRPTEVCDHQMPLFDALTAHMKVSNPHCLRRKSLPTHWSRREWGT